MIGARGASSHLRGRLRSIVVFVWSGGLEERERGREERGSYGGLDRGIGGGGRMVEVGGGGREGRWSGRRRG